jgi:iron complex outermembrane receptor protein
LLAEALELDVVVVTATRDSVRAGDVPYSISVVDRQTVERSGETALFQVLSKQVPGLFVTERSVAGYGISTGASGGLSIREWVRPHPGC